MLQKQQLDLEKLAEATLNKNGLRSDIEVNVPEASQPYS